MLETPLSKKEKATTKNTKITKEKILISKSKHTVNVENQPHIKLVGRLKDKHNKMGVPEKGGQKCYLKK